MNIKIILMMSIFMSTSFSAYAANLRCSSFFAKKQSRAMREVKDLKKLTVATYNLENFFYLTPADKANLKPNSEKWDLLKPEPEIQEIAKTLDEINMDIAVITEVDTLQSLTYLASKLDHEYRSFLIDGNDSRGIDIGFLIKADIRLVVEHESHKNRQWFDPVRQQTLPIFSRDLPALILRENSSADPFLIVIGNHAKAPIDRKGDPGSLIARKAQYEETAKIIKEYQDRFGEDIPIIVAGDFNTNIPTAQEISVIRDIVPSAFDLLDTPMAQRISNAFVDNNGVAHMQQLDDIRISNSATDALINAKIFGIRSKQGDRILPKTIEDFQHLPSDHLPVVVELAVPQIIN